MPHLRRLLFRLATGLALILLSAAASAVVVEAEGQAIVHNNDLEGARLAAIRSASEQALLQSAAYIESNQQLSQGVIQVDNLQVQSSGSLSNIRVLSERQEGNFLYVRIRAEVEPQAQCSPESTGQRFRKKLAVAAFPFAVPEHASLGGLHNAETAISRYLNNAINQSPALRALNASHLQVHSNLQTASASQWPHGALTDALQTFKDLDVQYIISGVLRDLSMINPETSRDENILKDLYDRLDYRGRQHVRNFSLDLYIHDGATGALLFSQRQDTLGLWNVDSHLRTGFATPSFFATDYGRQVKALLDQSARYLSNRLKCEPFRARILTTQRNRITFNAGSLDGIRAGDRFHVYRKLTFYDEQQRAQYRLENTREALIVNQVQPQFSEGKISVDTRERNIQQDDIVVAW